MGSEGASKCIESSGLYVADGTPEVSGWRGFTWVALLDGFLPASVHAHVCVSMCEHVHVHARVHVRIDQGPTVLNRKPQPQLKPKPQP